MKLLQFTDIHLTTPGNTIGNREPNVNFQRALDHAMQLHDDAEAIFITGDLSDWGEEADYKRLRNMLEPVSIPVHLCIGNHDDRPTFLTEFPEMMGDLGFVQNVVPLSIGHAITLDTWGPETHAGHFCEQRANWLDEQLHDRDGPVWIFMHHNPLPIHVAPMDKIMLLDDGRFREVVARHAQKIAHIFHGHCHLPLCGHINGVPFSAPRGTNHAGWPDFSAKEQLAAADLPESYSVIFAESNSTMVMMVEYGYNGSIRSEGSPDYESWDKLTMVR